jgi:MFS family permease
MLSDYKSHFGLFFTNKAAVAISIGCFFRYWEVSIVQFFVGNYMKVYASDYNAYSFHTAFASFIGAPVATMITGALVDYFGPKSELTIPIILICKALVEAPLNIMTFA